MSVYYYPRNEILTPRWISPPAARRVSRWVYLAAALVALAAILGVAWFALVHLPEENAKQATVIVWADTDGDGKMDSQGSGVLISPSGNVLTNRHVVVSTGGDKAAKIEVWFRSGSSDLQKMEATLTEHGQGVADLTPTNIRNDWAVVRVAPKSPLPFVRPSDRKDFAEEESVKSLGFPRAEETAANSYGASVKVVPGAVSRVDRSDEGGVNRLTHTAATAEGMSGGPLIQGGKLIGLNTQVLGGGEVTANENYALPAYLLQDPVFRQYGAER